MIDPDGYKIELIQRSFEYAWRHPALLAIQNCAANQLCGSIIYTAADSSNAELCVPLQ